MLSWGGRGGGRGEGEGLREEIGEGASGNATYKTDGAVSAAQCSLPVRLMMDASPAPMTILHASRVQKLLAKPQPTEDTMKMPMPQPVLTAQASIWCTLIWCA